MLKLLDKVFKGLLVILAFLMFFSILLGVFFRYILNSPLFWTSELATILMVVTMILCTFYVQLEHSHVKMVYFFDKFNKRTQKIIKIITYILMLYVLYILFNSGVSLVSNALIMKTPALRIPTYIPMLSIPIGAVLMGVVVIRDIFVKIKEK